MPRVRRKPQGFGQNQRVRQRMAPQPDRQFSQAERPGNRMDPQARRRVQRGGTGIVAGQSPRPRPPGFPDRPVPGRPQPDQTVSWRELPPDIRQQLQMTGYGRRDWRRRERAELDWSNTVAGRDPTRGLPSGSPLAWWMDARAQNPVFAAEIGPPPQFSGGEFMGSDLERWWNRFHAGGGSDLARTSRHPPQPSGQVPQIPGRPLPPGFTPSPTFGPNVLPPPYQPKPTFGPGVLQPPPGLDSASAPPVAAQPQPQTPAVPFQGQPVPTAPYAGSPAPAAPYQPAPAQPYPGTPAPAVPAQPQAPAVPFQGQPPPAQPFPGNAPSLPSTAPQSPQMASNVRSGLQGLGQPQQPQQTAPPPAPGLQGQPPVSQPAPWPGGQGVPPGPVNDQNPGPDANSLFLNPQYEAGVRALDDELSATLAQIGVSRQEAQGINKLIKERLGIEQREDLAANAEAANARGLFDSGIRTQGARGVERGYRQRTEDLDLDFVRTLRDLASGEMGARSGYSKGLAELLMGVANQMAGENNVPIGMSTREPRKPPPKKKRRRRRKRR